MAATGAPFFPASGGGGPGRCMVAPMPGTGRAVTTVASSLRPGRPARPAGSGAAAGALAAARMASANSWAERKRSSGRLARARAITPSKARGVVTDSCEGGGGSVCSALCITAEKPPSKGFSPVRSWYSMTPAAQMSARRSTGSPRNCSGAM